METRTLGCTVLAVLAMAIATAVLWGSGLLDPGLPDYRYRLTVEVETPEGLKTGSSVIEVKTSVAGRNSIPTPGVVSRRARGEAVTVDLGARGEIFALLRSDENSDWASGVMFGFAPDKIPRPLDENGKFDSSAHFKARFMAMLEHRDPIELPERFPTRSNIEGGLARPMLVRFGDLTDPTTVERVDPDDLAADFGPGVRLRRITVQFTDDPVTTGIVERLSWLSYQRGSLIPIPRGTPIGEMPIGSDITEGDFYRGTMK